MDETNHEKREEVDQTGQNQWFKKEQLFSRLDCTNFAAFALGGVFSGKGEGERKG